MIGTTTNSMFVLVLTELARNQFRRIQSKKLMLKIPTLIHGAIDYAVAASLIAAPELVDLSDDHSAPAFARAMGLAAACYSACTDYELGIVKVIPMPVHLRIDAAWAAALALGPWMLRFGRRGPRYWVPFTALAFAAAAIVSISDPYPPKQSNAT